MKTINEFYTSHLEWEAINFPVTLRAFSFAEKEYSFSDDTVIEIWRNDLMQLKGLVKGRIRNPYELDHTSFVGKGNIIKPDIINGTDQLGNNFTLNGCVLGKFTTKGLLTNQSGYLFELELIFDSANISFIKESNEILADNNKLFYWFLCSDVAAHFDGITVRNTNFPLKKVRTGIDAIEDAISFIGSSSSKDYVQLATSGLTCIISKVPDVFLNSGWQGLCFEFRDEQVKNIDKQSLNDLRSFVSFLIGAELFQIGFSKIRGTTLTDAFIDDPHLPLKVSRSMPPIRFNIRYEWGNFAWLINQFFPKYRELTKSLQLNQAIERFINAKQNPVGINLPILAGAVEVIADRYLKLTGNNKNEYLSQKDYESLIAEEFENIKVKMDALEGGDIILNKIAGAFRKGPNEKMNLFFFLLGLKIGKPERSAISLRNKMTHSFIDYEDDEKAYNDLILTRTYEVLFHRILLKLLKYEGYYIDYSIQGCPLKLINMEIGTED